MTDVNTGDWLQQVRLHTQLAVADVALRLASHLATVMPTEDPVRAAQRAHTVLAVQAWAEPRILAAGEAAITVPHQHPLARMVALGTADERTQVGHDRPAGVRAEAWADVLADVMVLAALPHAHECLAALLRLWHPDGEPCATVTLALSWLEASGRLGDDETAREALRRALSSGPLARLGLWRLRGDRSDGPWHSRSLQLDEVAWAAWSGRSPEGAGAPLEGGAATVPGLDDWLAQTEVQAAALALQQGQPCQILVQGGTAAMRRTRVRALLGLAGVAAVRVAQASEGQGQAWLYQAAWWLEDTHDALPGGAPLAGVDDGALEDAGTEGFAEAHRWPLTQICSAAHAGAVPVTGLPRLRLQVRALTPVARRSLWSTLLPQLGDQAAVLAARYPIEPDEARDVVRDLALRQTLLQRPMNLDDVADGVRARVTAVQRAGVTRVVPQAGWDALLVPPVAVEALQAAVRRVSQQLTVLDDWGFAQGRGDRRGVRLLFHGTPGTGKTLAAEVMARALGVDLLVVDLASLVSKWIGETEKNLAAVFDLAERSRALLLFDEADALFGKRTDTQDAQDRYANLETAYLLQRLERYEGVAVLTTNLRSQLDAAFSRRFEFIVEFPEPEVRVRQALWRLHLPDQAPLAPDVDLAELADWYPLSGAQIKNAALAAAFLAAAEGHAGRQAMGQRHFLVAIEREYDKAGRAHPGFPAHHTLNPSGMDDWRTP